MNYKLRCSVIGMILLTGTNGFLGVKIAIWGVEQN